MLYSGQAIAQICRSATCCAIISQSPDESGSYSSHLGQRNSHLPLILSAAIFIRRFTDLIALEEQHLRHTFIGINFRGQWSGIGKFQCHITFPLRLERRDIDDDTATRISGFAEADGHTLRGMRKYSTVRASANEFGGIMQ
jgi:hypothetical protein